MQDSSGQQLRTSGRIAGMASGGWPQPSRILVIVMRRLGDVLLATALLRTLRTGFPRATIDVLVFRGTEGMLAGNPDISAILTLPQHPGLRETLALVGKLWRRYDLAISTQAGDRPTFLAFAAGRHRIGLVPGAGGGWKRRVLDHAVPAEPEIHRVVELLRLVECLGIAPQPELVCPTASPRAPIPLPFPPPESASQTRVNALMQGEGRVGAGRYAVLHANPMFRFRRWTDAGWRSLAQALGQRGLGVVVTGGPDAAEKAYLDQVWQSAEPAVVRLDGKLDWPDLANLLRGAAVYVGPDTSMTHLAAASGCPTVALYGPASPSLIGPWPVGGLDAPWARAGTIQHRGNVWVVQNPLPCMPCDKLGCERHLESYSLCLDELAASRVLAAVDQALGR
jgi:lipopolysaccharide heptosyltransferase III